MVFGSEWGWTRDHGGISYLKYARDELNFMQRTEGERAGTRTRVTVRPGTEFSTLSCYINRKILAECGY